MAHIKSLKPLTEKTDTYRNWVKYIYDILNTYGSTDDVLGSITSELFKSNYQTFSKIKNELLIELDAKNAEETEFNNLKALAVIEEIFINLNRYNDEFTTEKLDEIFKAIKVKWNKNDFEVLKQISVAVSKNWNEFVSLWITSLCKAIEPISSELRKQTILSKFTLPLITDSIKSHYDILFTPLSNIEGLLVAGPFYTFKLKGLENIQHSQDYIDALNSLHSGLIKNGYIHSETHFSKTKRIFSGQSIKLDDSQKITWIKSDVQLHYFIDLFSVYVETPSNGIWNVATNCFIKKGKKNYDSRKLGKAKVKEVKDVNKSELNRSVQYIINLMP